MRVIAILEMTPIPFDVRPEGTNSTLNAYMLPSGLHVSIADFTPARWLTIYSQFDDRCLPCRRHI